MKKNNINILYIGNNLFRKTNYSTSYDILSKFLSQEGFNIYKRSSISLKLFRLLDMCYSVFRFRHKINYVLIDTYSTSNFYFALITSQLCRFFKLKYIPILHGGNLPFRLKNNPLFCSLIFDNSYKNISPSGYLMYEFNLAGYDSLLIPNIVPVSGYSFKHRINIRPKLLYVRAFDKIYNPEMAVDVLYELKKEYSNAILCMVGPDRDGTLKKVTKKITKYNLKDSIEITGVLSKKEWHKKSEFYDLFINTTNVDNTPISVIEAMALGLTIVSTNVGGIPFLIDDNKDGVLVNKGDVISMKNAISDIIEQKNSELSKRARLKAESFDWIFARKIWLKILN